MFNFLGKVCRAQCNMAGIMQNMSSLASYMGKQATLSQY